MRSRASFAAAVTLFTAASAPAAAQSAPPPEPSYEEPQGDGPRGSSRDAQSRYDEVGYAAVDAMPGVALVSGALQGGYAEVTALDTGKTVIVAVKPGETGNRLIRLSATAAAEIGITGDAAGVRVRRTSPSPQDVSLLQSGQLAGGRAPAPQALLVPLRKRLGAPPVAVAVAQPRRQIAVAPRRPVPSPIKPLPSARAIDPPQRPVDTPAPATAPIRPVGPPPTRQSAPINRGQTPGYYVQVAALSDQGRAHALASNVGGFVEPLGKLYRVQIGPFPDNAGAARARAATAKQGYPDARIVRVN